MAAMIRRSDLVLAVLNRDDQSFEYLWELTQDVNQVSYSLEG